MEDNERKNSNELTETEVLMAIALGIQFRHTPMPNGYVQVETVRPVKFFYEPQGIRIEEYWPDGIKTYKVPVA